ncbi:MAG: hypothetical protein PGN13_16515 [Patulibacter minatonensis]
MSSDEFVVTASYADARAVLETNQTAEFMAVRWRDPDGDHFEELCGVPTYTEAPLSVRTSSVVAVRRLEGHLARSVERARDHEVGRWR